MTQARTALAARRPDVRRASLGRLVAGALAGALMLGGCGRAGEARPSVLLVTVDTLRADAVSAWGRETGTTPRMDALAGTGLRFDAATTVTPLTLPAHASLLTGWRPARIGLTVNGVAQPGLPVPTLAQRLSQAGYATAAFVSATVLDRRYGLSAGFAHYDDDLAVPGGPADPFERRADATIDRALAWTGWTKQPFFAWVHLYDPHAPYAAPGGAEGIDRAAYLDEVRYTDRQLGRLLDEVAARARGPVLVVLTSDHGEGLGEHGEETHGLLLNESTLHVPLLMSWLKAPGGDWPAAGQRRADSVSLLDVTPTLLELLGLPPVTDGDGVSVRQPRPGRALPLETRAPWFYYGFSSLAGVRRDALKLVGAPSASEPAWTLFDLGADPQELSGSVVSDQPLIASVRSPEPAAEAAAVGDPTVLQQLGYVGSEPPSASDGPLLDPRTQTGLIVVLDRAHTALARGDAAQALLDLDRLEPRWSEAPERLYLRGRTLAQLGRLDEAATSLARACELRPTAELLTERGLVLLRLSDHGEPTVDAAIACLDRALAASPEDPRATSLRARADLAAGRAPAALARIEAALARRPHDAFLLSAQRDIRAATSARAAAPAGPR